MNHWLLICLAALANVALNLCLKLASASLDASHPRALAISLFTSLWMWLAGLCALILLSAFVAAVRLYSLSLTYTAVTSLAMILLTLAGALILRESIAPTRLLGLGLIVGGLVLCALAPTAPRPAAPPVRVDETRAPS